MKISEKELELLDQLITLNKETTVLEAKSELNLVVSTRSIHRYLNKLGWTKIVVRFFQYVSTKNRIERIIFCQMCKLSRDDFSYSIFIDE